MESLIGEGRRTEEEEGGGRGDNLVRWR